MKARSVGMIGAALAASGALTGVSQQPAYDFPDVQDPRAVDNMRRKSTRPRGVAKQKRAARKLRNIRARSGKR